MAFFFVIISDSLRGFENRKKIDFDSENNRQIYGLLNGCVSMYYVVSFFLVEFHYVSLRHIYRPDIRCDNTENEQRISDNLDVMIFFASKMKECKSVHFSIAGMYILV